MLDTKIYVVTHKKCEIPDDELYVRLQVGKEINQDFGYLGDNNGDNISLKNPNYCELTGMYWMWKNTKTDKIGLCHYRRYFMRNKTFMTKEYIDSILDEYDVILPPKILWKETVYNQYAINHKEEDMVVVREVIKEKYEEYLRAFDHVMDGHTAYITNMMITHKEILNKYCEWLFDILFEVERRIDISNYNDYQKRVFGFVSERLLNVWIANNELKVREEEAFIVEL